VLQVIYPVESFFYPYHLIIALVTCVIFLVIVLSYRNYVSREREKKDEEWGKKNEKQREKDQAQREKDEKQGPTSKADAIAVASLIATIVITGVLPLLLSPLLDYSISPLENGNKLTIDITNLGLATANNIISSVSAKNVNFSNFESEPFLANHFRANGSILGKGFFEISTMPPRSETIVNATLDTSKAGKNEQLKVYLRSDERVGFHDTLITSIFYLGLGVIYVGLFIYLVYRSSEVDGKDGKEKKKKLEQIEPHKIVIWILAIAVGEIVVTVIYYYIYFPFPSIMNLPPV
jgi:hypothetical protein